MKTAFSIALLLMLAACSKTPTSEPTSPAPAPEAAGSEPLPDGASSGSSARRMFIECPAESRGAEVCTMDYSPVCGQHADEKPAQTYSNVCGACKDANVTGYFTGECETGANE